MYLLNARKMLGYHGKLALKIFFERKKMKNYKDYAFFWYADACHFLSKINKVDNIAIVPNIP